MSRLDFHLVLGVSLHAGCIAMHGFRCCLHGGHLFYLYFYGYMLVMLSPTLLFLPLAPGMFMPVNSSRLHQLFSYYS